MDFEDPYPITFSEKTGPSANPFLEFYQGGRTIANIPCPNKIANAFYYHYDGSDRTSEQMPRWIASHLRNFNLEGDTFNEIYYHVLRAADEHVDWLKVNKPILETKNVNWKKHGF